MKLSLRLKATITGVMLVGLCGCASIVSLVDTGSRTVRVKTEPEGATVTVSKKSGEQVTTATTPATIKLPRYHGYMSGQDYVLRIELTGYRPVDLEVRSTFNAWYIGNIAVGGVIGLFIVDPLTGAMWRLSPNRIEQKLTPQQSSMIQNGEAFGIILKSQATENELNAAEPLAFH
jgi:hypothetical protein